MAFIWKPGIYRATTPAGFYELPRPVRVLTFQDRWDSRVVRVPFQQRVTLRARSQNGLVILIEGEAGTQAGTLKGTEEAMFTEMETLRAKVNVQAEADQYEFYLYHDIPSGTYRKFKACNTSELEIDVTDKDLFRYRLVVETSDRVVYATQPGF